MALKVNFIKKLKNSNIFKVSLFFLTIFAFIIVSNILNTPQDNTFFQKEYDSLRNFVKNQFNNKVKQLEYFTRKKDVTQIILWHNLYPQEQIIVKNIIEDFEKTYPGIQIKDVHKSHWGQICKSVANSLPMNKQPHLTFSYNDHIEFYSKSHKVIPLDIFIDEDQEFQQLDQQQFFPGYYEKIKLENEYDQKEHHYSLPFAKSTEVMFYDSDFLKEHRKILNQNFLDKHSSDFKDNSKNIIDVNGIIDLVSLKEYLTWNHMETLCETIKTIKKQKDFVPITIESTANLFIIANEQKTMSYPDNVEKARDFFHNEEAKKTMKYFKEKFYEKGFLTTSKLIGEPSIKEIFLQRKSCMFITSTRRLDLMHKKKSNFNIEMTPIPTMNSKNYKNIIQGPNINLFYSPHRDEILASWLFLKKLVSKDTYIELLEKKGSFTITRKDVKEHFDQTNDIQKTINKIKDKIKEIDNLKNEESDTIRKTLERELNKYKSIEFARTHTYDNNKEGVYFTSPVFLDSNFFRIVLEGLFNEVLAFNTDGVNIDSKIELLFNEAYQRIITH
ncbi:MAG: ABC transporter substrate-binding protein [Weeping tea tree witches'-broom phytoplasma]|uniref:ABC transporter substrate-binding protein n=1 Tax=Candidatus Phytoplasma melaleucae TaxID=2982630 RepID=UPI00293ACE71|nr:ABC transporter substrate-binding protein [Weeping tea tree witches'-broom phytoplasma]